MARANDDYVTTDQDTPVTINVLSNDRRRSHFKRITSAPTKGNAVVHGSGQGALVIYTPNTGALGADQFTYEIEPGGHRYQATCHIDIRAHNTPPVAVPDTFSTPQNTTLVKNAVDLLVNDGPNPSQLSIQSVQSGVNGTPSLKQGGNKVEFEPAHNFVGTGSFEYTVEDNTSNQTASALVTIAIQPVSPQTFWNNGDAAHLRNKPTTWQVTPNVSHCEPGTLTQNSKDDFIQYLSEIRALHGLSPCVFDDGTFNYDKEQQASALYQAANAPPLDHTPDSGKPCYSADAYQGAVEGNLAMTAQSGSAHALEYWMRDNGVAHARNLGHRTWILSPALIRTAYGEVKDGGPSFSSMRARNHSSGGHNQPQVVACPQPGTDYPIELFNGNWHHSDGTSYDNPQITVSEQGTGNIQVTPGFNGLSPYGNVQIIAWHAPVIPGNTYDVTIVTSNKAPIHYTVKVINIT